MIIQNLKMNFKTTITLLFLTLLNGVSMAQTISSETLEDGVNSKDSIALKKDELKTSREKIVTIGYRSTSVSKISGTVGVVNVRDAIKFPAINIAESLQGRVAGVNVVTNGPLGSIPSIRINGYGTFNSNKPLFIIDGVQSTDPFILNSINPNDIAQINVLKGASAAIYGSRGANGVIIVKTKK